MHTCIMVKVGGNEIHVKYVKHVNFTKSGGKFAKEKFPEIVGNELKQGNRGDSKFVVND